MYTGNKSQVVGNKTLSINRTYVVKLVDDAR